MPEREFELYLSVLSRLLRLSPQQKDAIADELRDHLEERFEELVRSGVPRDDAIRQALDEFGDAAGLAVDFTAVSKKRIRRLIMRSTAAVTALVALIAFFLIDLRPQQPGAPALPGPAMAVAQSDSNTPSDSSDQKDQAAISNANESEPPPLPPLERISGPPLLPQELELWTQFEFKDIPLIDAAQFISDLHDIPVVFDTVAFDDAGLNTDIPVTLSIKDPPELLEALQKEGVTPEEARRLRAEYSDHLVPLYQGLDWLLRPLGLSWYVEDEVLHITTIEAETDRQFVRSYSVRQLLRSGISAVNLKDTIDTMTPGYWERTDGAGGSMSVVGQVLTVRQSYQMHRQVESLLAALSRRSEWHYVNYPRRHVRQLELLERRVDRTELIDAPLYDVIEYMTLTAGVPIRIDERALADEGIAGDEPVSLNLPDRPLRTVLKLTLDPLNLTAVVKDGALTVTTLAAAENDDLLHTIVYDVRELEAAPRTGNMTRVEALVDAILNTTSHWLEVDGSGGEMQIPGGGRLVVRQSDEVHGEIRKLLDAQRRLLQEPDDDNAPQALPPDSQVETRFYRVPTEAAEDLMTAIPELVAPGTWQFVNGMPMMGGGGNLAGPPAGHGNGLGGPTGNAIRKVNVGTREIVRKSGPGNDAKKSQAGSRTLLKETVLIIRNARSVHTKIDSFLSDLGLNVKGVAPGNSPAKGGGFF